MNTEKYIAELMKLARRAYAKGEVPVGAIVIDGKGKIIGRGVNKTNASKDGLMHAELVAIRQAEKKLGDWRLSDCEIYITLEPCLMCLGAIGNARVEKIYYLLEDKLFGSLVSKLSPEQVKKLYPKLRHEKLAGGEQVARLMADFFKDLRRKQKELRMGSVD